MIPKGLISVVIPVHNEEASILPLYDRLTAVLQNLGHPYEIIFVDDASTDQSYRLLSHLTETDTHLTAIRLRRNFGQTAALAAGFNEAQGEVIVAMDGDLQNQPEDIPLLLEKMDEGYDLVSGWRKDRQDHPVTRLLPSRMANWLISRISGVQLHDFGATLKAYRAEVLKDIRLYGQLHRFIPALASFYGARIAEIPIRHTARSSGVSHYGLGRTFAVVLDLITIKFLLSYINRPMHLFGKFGILSTAVGTVALGYLLVLKLMGESIARHGPLMVAASLLWLAGLMMFSTGLIGELLIRAYFEGSNRSIYSIREIRTQRGDATVPSEHD